MPFAPARTGLPVACPGSWQLAARRLFPIDSFLSLRASGGVGSRISKAAKFDTRALLVRTVAGRERLTDRYCIFIQYNKAGAKKSPQSEACGVRNAYRRKPTTETLSGTAAGDVCPT